MLWQTRLLLLVIFWTIAYAFAIFHAIRYKSHGIPALAVALNFAWELIATIYYHEYVGIVWLLVDAVIVFFIIKEYRGRKWLLFLHAFAFIACCVACVLFFEREIFPGCYGFVFICFLIDVTMAADFLFELFLNKIAVNGISLCVAIFKLIGSFIAWDMYRDMPAVLALGFGSLVINLLYTIFVAIRLAKRRHA